MATWNQRIVKVSYDQSAEGWDRVRRQAEVKSAEKYTQAAQRASLWDKSKDCVRHDYLEKKQVLSYGLKEDVMATVIPMKDGQGTIVGLQFIAGDGTKRFLTGSKKSGSFFLLGREIFNSSARSIMQRVMLQHIYLRWRSQPVVGVWRL